ncbi:MAG: hypothetical protein HYY50_03715 [Candidatus Kerfeldbacteria bacterium]|nr:hypothetical protein [Candidatus Kerfeldbacteria bacterium]
MNQLTKTLLGTLALIGLLGLSTFWWTGMHVGESHNCLSATIQNEVCPNATTTEAAVFHGSSLQSLTSNLLPPWQFTGLLLALVFVVLAALAGSISLQTIGVPAPPENRHSLSPPRQYQRWLARLEHSPSVLLGRV